MSKERSYQIVIDANVNGDVGVNDIIVVNNATSVQVVFRTMHFVRCVDHLLRELDKMIITKMNPSKPKAIYKGTDYESLKTVTGDDREAMESLHDCFIDLRDEFGSSN